MEAQDTIGEVYVTERINGWWVTVRYDSGHEEHHGPYLDEESARDEVDLLLAEKPGTREQAVD